MNKLIFKLFHACFVFLLLVLVTISLTSCIPSINGRAVHIPNETAKNPEAYFCPREDCSKAFEDNIELANYSVHCALYDIDLKNVINALSKKSKNADVKIVIDDTNSKGQIKGDGLRVDNEKQLMHNKFCVVDGYTVVTGSFNPTYNDNFKNNNNVIVIYSKALADNYEDEFSELWNGVFGKGRTIRSPEMLINGVKIENYFCPEDNCESHIISLIDNAKSDIYFMSFSFTNEAIADSLIKKSSLKIKGIFDSSQSSNKYSQFKRLKDFGLDVKLDSNKYKMHHKVFIIDNETVVTGSFNPTLSAEEKNDENMLIIHDKRIAKRFLEEFKSLWAP